MSENRTPGGYTPGQGGQATGGAGTGATDAGTTRDTGAGAGSQSLTPTTDFFNTGGYVTGRRLNAAGALAAAAEADTTNKQNYFNAFVSRARFGAAYPGSMTAAQFVDALNANAGQVLSDAERGALVQGLGSGTLTRAQDLRAVAEDADTQRQELNRAFVLMQYFGYLRRDPDAAPDADFAGYSFWLGKLDEFNGNWRAAEMVKAFVSSIEYRKRFGTP